MIRSPLTALAFALALACSSASATPPRKATTKTRKVKEQKLTRSRHVVGYYVYEVKFRTPSSGKQGWKIEGAFRRHEMAECLADALKDEGMEVRVVKVMITVNSSGRKIPIKPQPKLPHVWTKGNSGRLK